MLEVLAQFVRALPHLTQLAPLLQRFVDQRGSDSAALAGIRDKMQSDLNGMQTSHASLEKQVRLQAGMLSDIRSEIFRLQESQNNLDNHISSIESDMKLTKSLMIAVMIMLFIVLGLLSFLIVRHV